MMTVGCFRKWPEILAGLNASRGNKIFCLRTGRVREVSDPGTALQLATNLFLRCQKSPCFLHAEWSRCSVLRKTQPVATRSNQGSCFALDYPRSPEFDLEKERKDLGDLIFRDIFGLNSSVSDREGNMQRFDCLAKETAIFGPTFFGSLCEEQAKHLRLNTSWLGFCSVGNFTLEQILVVTFTRAAARELKLRIRSNLDRLLSSAFASTELHYLEEGTHLRPIEDARACNTLNDVRIFTIHSFCSRMLTEFGDSKEAGTAVGKREAGIRDFLEFRLTPDLICPEQLELLLRWAGSMERARPEAENNRCYPETAPKTFAERLQEFRKYHYQAARCDQAARRLASCLSPITKK